MNTFLPYPDIIKSVQCLDNKRLGKQRVEAYQILRVLAGLTKGWRNHPAVRMWDGFDCFLTIYYNASIDEWIKRGFRNKMLKATLPLTKLTWRSVLEGYVCSSDICPKWWGNEKFHSAHRAALLAKNYEWYFQFGWTEKPKIEYYWPV